jgi:tetratricopeptide (TPR) repeat protein
LDNCDDDLIDFAKYIPSRGGRVIITTRLTECHIHGAWENIDDLGPEFAVRLLLKASGLEDGDQNALKPVATSVVAALGQHALALVHAGAYIKKGYCTLSEYVQFFQNEQTRLLEFKPKQQASRYGSVYTTFEVSAKALASSERHDSHLALKLLNILAFMDREAVREDIFIRAFDECHDREGVHCVVWEENEAQWFQCSAALSTENVVTKHHYESENSDSCKDIEDVSCSWRGAYRCYTESEMLQDWEESQDSTDPMSEQKPISDSGQSSKVPDCSTNLVTHCPPQVYNTTHELPESGNYDDEPNAEAVEDCEEHEDDGDIDHLDLSHCDKVRSSGLVELQKSTRLRAACIRLAELSLVKFDKNEISMHPLVHEWARTRLSGVAREDAWEQALSILALSKDFTPDSNLMSHIDFCIRSLAEKKSQLGLSLHVTRALYNLALMYNGTRGHEIGLAILEILLKSDQLQPRKVSFKSTLILRQKARHLSFLQRHEEMKSCVDQVVQYTARYFEPDSLYARKAQALLADYHLESGDYQAAATLYESLYEQQLCSVVPDDSLMSDLTQGRIHAYRFLGNHEQAVPLLIQKMSGTQYSAHDSLEYLASSYIQMGAAEKAVELLEDFCKPDSSQMLRDHRWFEVRSTLAQAYRDLEEYDKAISILEDIILHTPMLFRPYHPIMFQISPIVDLAAIYRDIDKPIQVVQLLEEVAKICESNLPPDDPVRLSNKCWLAKTHRRLDNPCQAVILLEDVVKVEASSLPLDNSTRLFNMGMLAEIYLELQQPKQAVKLLVEVVEIRTSSLSSKDENRLGSMRWLAHAYLRLGEPSQAMPLLEELVHNMPADSPRRLDIFNGLADTYFMLNKLGQMVTLLEELIKSVPPHEFSSDLGASMEKLASALWQLRKPDQAVSALERVIALYRAHLVEDHMNRLRAMQSLAMLYNFLGTSEKVKKAVSLLEEVIETGRETLHADPVWLHGAQVVLADAREKLRQTSHQQLLVDFEEEQGIPDDTVERTSGITIRQRLRRLVKRVVRIF